MGLELLRIAQANPNSLPSIKVNNQEIRFDAGQFATWSKDITKQASGREHTLEEWETLIGNYLRFIIESDNLGLIPRDQIPPIVLTVDVTGGTNEPIHNIEINTSPQPTQLGTAYFRYK